jgi:hypothetical protein
MARRLPADVQKIIDSQSPKLLRKDFNDIVQDRFNKIKNELIQEFLNHPVTQEIKAGPNTTNISGTLNGKGNLFSFIGFYEGDDPIQDILNNSEAFKNNKEEFFKVQNDIYGLLNNEEFNKNFPDFIFTNFNDGLIKTIEYYRNILL